MLSNLSPSTRRLSIQALLKEIQGIAVDANLFDLGMAEYPYAEKCSRKKKDLLRAIAELSNKDIQYKQEELWKKKP